MIPIPSLGSKDPNLPANLPPGPSAPPQANIPRPKQPAIMAPPAPTPKAPKINPDKTQGANLNDRWETLIFPSCPPISQEEKMMFDNYSKYINIQQAWVSYGIYDEVFEGTTPIAESSIQKASSIYYKFHHEFPDVSKETSLQKLAFYHHVVKNPNKDWNQEKLSLEQKHLIAEIVSERVSYENKDSPYSTALKQLEYAILEKSPALVGKTVKYATQKGIVYALVTTGGAAGQRVAVLAYPLIDMAGEWVGDVSAGLTKDVLDKLVDKREILKEIDRRQGVTMDQLKLVFTENEIVQIFDETSFLSKPLNVSLSPNTEYEIGSLILEAREKDRVAKAATQTNTPPSLDANTQNREAMREDIQNKVKEKLSQFDTKIINQQKEQVALLNGIAGVLETYLDKNLRSAAEKYAGNLHLDAVKRQIRLNQEVSDSYRIQRKHENLKAELDLSFHYLKSFYQPSSLGVVNGAVDFISRHSEAGDRQKALEMYQNLKTMIRQQKAVIRQKKHFLHDYKRHYKIHEQEYKKHARKISHSKPLSGGSGAAANISFASGLAGQVANHPLGLVSTPVAGAIATLGIGATVVSYILQKNAQKHAFARQRKFQKLQGRLEKERYKMGLAESYMQRSAQAIENSRAAIGELHMMINALPNLQTEERIAHAKSAIEDQEKFNNRMQKRLDELESQEKKVKKWEDKKQLRKKLEDELQDIEKEIHKLVSDQKKPKDYDERLKKLKKGKEKKKKEIDNLHSIPTYQHRIDKFNNNTKINQTERQESIADLKTGLENGHKSSEEWRKQIDEYRTEEKNYQEDLGVKKRKAKHQEGIIQDPSQDQDSSSKKAKTDSANVGDPSKKTSRSDDDEESNKTKKIKTGESESLPPISPEQNLEELRENIPEGVAKALAKHEAEDGKLYQALMGTIGEVSQLLSLSDHTKFLAQPSVFVMKFGIQSHDLYARLKILKSALINYLTYEHQGTKAEETKLKEDLKNKNFVEITTLAAKALSDRDWVRIGITDLADFLININTALAATNLGIALIKLCFVSEKSASEKKQEYLEGQFSSIHDKLDELREGISTMSRHMDRQNTMMYRELTSRLQNLGDEIEVIVDNALQIRALTVEQFIYDYHNQMHTIMQNIEEFKRTLALPGAPSTKALFFIQKKVGVVDDNSFNQTSGITEDQSLSIQTTNGVTLLRVDSPNLNRLFAPHHFIGHFAAKIRLAGPIMNPELLFSYTDLLISALKKWSSSSQHEEKQLTGMDVKVIVKGVLQRLETLETFFNQIRQHSRWLDDLRDENLHLLKNIKVGLQAHVNRFSQVSSAETERFINELWEIRHDDVFTDHRIKERLVGAVKFLPREVSRMSMPDEVIRTWKFGSRVYTKARNTAFAAAAINPQLIAPAAIVGAGCELVNRVSGVVNKMEFTELSSAPPSNACLSVCFDSEGKIQVFNDFGNPIQPRSHAIASVRSNSDGWLTNSGVMTVFGCRISEETKKELKELPESKSSFSVIVKKDFNKITCVEDYKAKTNEHLKRYLNVVHCLIHKQRSNDTEFQLWRDILTDPNEDPNKTCDVIYPDNYFEERQDSPCQCNVPLVLPKAVIASLEQEKLFSEFQSKCKSQIATGKWTYSLRRRINATEQMYGYELVLVYKAAEVNAAGGIRNLCAWHDLFEATIATFDRSTVEAFSMPDYDPTRERYRLKVNYDEFLLFALCGSPIINPYGMGLADHKTVSVFDVKSVIFLNEQPFIGLYRIFKYIPKKIFTFDHKKYNEDTRNYFENQNYAKQSVPIPSLQTSEQVQVPDSEQPTPMISDQADSLNQHNKNFFGPAIKLNPVRNGMEEFSYYSVFERVRPSRNYKLLETLKEERKKLVTNYETAIGLIRLAFSSELDVAIDRAKTYGFLPPPMLDSLILSDPQSLIDYLSAKIAKPKRPIDLSTFGSSHYIEQLDERKGLLQNYLENDKLQLSEQIPASVRVRTISEMEEEIKVFMELCDDKADEIKQSYRTEINPTDLEDRIYKSIYRGKIPTITGSYSFTEVPNNARHEGEYGEGYRALNVTRENMLKDLIDSLKVAEKSEFISECIIKQIEQDIDNNELCELSSKKELVKAKKAQDEAFKQCTNVCKEVKELFNGVPDNILEQRLDELIQQYKNITDDDKNILNELIKVKDHLNQLKLASQNFEKLASENNFTEYLQRTIEKGPLRCYLAQAWAYTKPLNLFIWGHESDSDLPQEISLLFEDSPYDSKIKEQVDILYSVSKVKVSDKESSLVHKFVRLKRI